jgi:hypothetical protein
MPMRPRSPLVAIGAGDRWLLAFTLAAVGVVVIGGLIRSPLNRVRIRRVASEPAPHALRRAGALIAAGPLLGFATSPTLGEHALLVAVGAVALAVAGSFVEHRVGAGRLVFALAAIAGLGAVVFGVRWGPTGVAALDMLGAAVIVVAVTMAADGLGPSGGTAASLGGATAVGIAALAGFAGQDSLAAVSVGLLGACVAYLALNLLPAAAIVGRGSRLAIGYALAVGALSVTVPVGPTGSLLVPLVVLGLLVLDAVVVVGRRLRRGRGPLEPEGDHLVARLIARGWSRTLTTAVLVVAQLVLSVTAVLTGRGVLDLWVGVAVAGLVLAVLALGAAHGRVERAAPGLGRWALLTGVVVVVGVVLATVPTVLAVPDVHRAMERGRDAASRALSAARDGDEATAEAEFRRASAAFENAHETLDAWTRAGAVAVPGLAQNFRAARTLADIGLDLARAGEQVTLAVEPGSLEVIDGRLPLETVQAVTPELEASAATLEDAVARMRAIDDPYLIAPVRDAIDDIETELVQITGEARRSAAAARLAPAIFGGEGQRNYLLLVQNNAELRATGGLIGNWGLLTAVDGDVSVGRLQRASDWNEAVRALPDPAIDVPEEYLRRYGFRPQFSLQDANLSPDFPTVARLLSSLAPQIGLPPVDGVLAVDPIGLAALLELTGPVRVDGWPEEITAENVVDITLRRAYEAFAETPERADFLGDVAEVVVDAATSVDLGPPGEIARVLGGAAHEGHLTLAFTDPAEERLAKLLDVAGELAPVRSDALAVNTQNAGANKIDYYLDRSLEYHVRLEPDIERRQTRVEAELTLRLDNTAPAVGLPQIVIGPYTDDYVAGVNRSLVSVYSPLDIETATVDGVPVDVVAVTEAGRTAYGLFVDIPAESSRTLEVRLSGTVPLESGGWYDLDLDAQPTLEPDRVSLAVEVADGWEIAEAPGLERPSEHQATGSFVLERPRRVMIRVVPDPPELSLWDQLRAGPGA